MNNFIQLPVSSETLTSLIDRAVSTVTGAGVQDRLEANAKENNVPVGDQIFMAGATAMLLTLMFKHLDSGKRPLPPTMFVRRTGGEMALFDAMPLYCQGLGHEAEKEAIADFLRKNDVDCYFTALEAELSIQKVSAKEPPTPEEIVEVVEDLLEQAKEGTLVMQDTLRIEGEIKNALHFMAFVIITEGEGASRGIDPESSPPPVVQPTKDNPHCILGDVHGTVH